MVNAASLQQDYSVMDAKVQNNADIFRMTYFVTSTYTRRTSSELPVVGFDTEFPHIPQEPTTKLASTIMELVLEIIRPSLLLSFT